jgi:hypothetical protein
MTGDRLISSGASISTTPAKSLGAFVIGVVSKEARAARARALGCDAVLVWDACDLAAEVSRLTDGHKAHVVYDDIGKLTFAASLDGLRPRGLMVSFGSSTGVPDPVAVGTLNAKGSLFLTRPGLAAHATELGEYHLRAHAVLEAVNAGSSSRRPGMSSPFPMRLRRMPLWTKAGRPERSSSSHDGHAQSSGPTGHSRQSASIFSMMATQYSFRPDADPKPSISPHESAHGKYRVSALNCKCKVDDMFFEALLDYTVVPLERDFCDDGSASSIQPCWRKVR